MNSFMNSKKALKRSSTSKCIKLQLGKSYNETLHKDLSLGVSKLVVVDNTVTGQCDQTEHFGGMERMRADVSRQHFIC